MPTSFYVDVMPEAREAGYYARVMSSDGRIVYETRTFSLRHDAQNAGSEWLAGCCGRRHSWH